MNVCDLSCTPRTSHMQNIKLFSEVQIALLSGVEEGQEEECLMSRYTTYNTVSN